MKYEQNLKKVLLTTDFIYYKLTNKNLIKITEDFVLVKILQCFDINYVISSVYDINVKSHFPDEDGFAELVTDFLEDCKALKNIALTNFFELTTNIYREGDFIFDKPTNQAICEIEGNTWGEINYVAKFTIIKNIINTTLND